MCILGLQVVRYNGNGDGQGKLRPRTIAMTKREPVAWIETVSESEADGPLKSLYDRARDPKTSLT